MKPILEIKNVSLAYNDEIIAREISFDAYEGEVVCIVGRSGCGKSTLFHALSGLHSVQEGDIVLKGKSIVDKPGHISYMLQKDLLLPNKRIVDNVALPYILRGVNLDIARQRAYELLLEFDLEDYANKWPFELSGGMRQRVALLRTYAADNEVILLDEAFSALDAMTRLEVRSWFLSSALKSRKCVVAITHDIDEAASIADKIYIMAFDTNKGYSSLEGPIYTHKDGMDSNEFMLTDRFLDIKKCLINELKI